MNIWTEELGAEEIAEEEWAKREEALGFPREDRLGPLLDEEDEDEGDEDLEDVLRGKPSTTVAVIQSIENREIARVEFAGNSREIPAGFKSDQERMAANVWRIEYCFFDENGIEAGSTITYFDTYGRQLPLKR